MRENHPIKAYRERQTPPWSQERFGREVEVTRFTVIRWENGAPIDEKKLPAVSKLIEVPAKELRPDLVERHEEIFGAAQ